MAWEAQIDVLVCTSNLLEAGSTVFSLLDAVSSPEGSCIDTGEPGLEASVERLDAARLLVPIDAPTEAEDQEEFCDGCLAVTYQNNTSPASLAR